MDDAYELLKNGFTVFGIKSFECENDPLNLCLARNNRPMRFLVAIQDSQLLDYTAVYGVKYPTLTNEIIETVLPENISRNEKGEIIIKVQKDLTDELILSEYRNAISTKLRPMLLKHDSVCENFDGIVKEFKSSKFTVVDKKFEISTGANKLSSNIVSGRSNLGLNGSTAQVRSLGNAASGVGLALDLLACLALSKI